MDAGELPSAQHGVQRPAPALPEMAVTAEGQFPDVAGDEALGHVELRRAPFRAQVVPVLRLAKDTGIDPRAAAARRDVIGRASQRLSPGIADHPGESFRKAPLQARLQ